LKRRGEENPEGRKKDLTVEEREANLGGGSRDLFERGDINPLCKKDPPNA